ncbi:MAG: adenylate kinase family protein [Thermoproteota archaeon]
MRKFLVITGTPGTGKSTASEMLAASMSWRHIDVGKLASRKRLFKGYDRKRKIPIVDLRRIKAEVLSSAESTRSKVILDGSYSHLILPRKFVMAVIVLRCYPTLLASRLRKKRWSEQKIRENVQSEILGVCESEALMLHDKVCEIDTTKIKAEEVCKAIISLYERGFPETRRIDWLSKLISDRSFLSWMI